MKYIVFSNFIHLTQSLLGDAVITSNPYEVLRAKAYSSVALYKCENEAPTGSFKVRIDESRICLDDGQCYGCKRINLSEVHTLVFEPDSHYSSLHTGFCKEIDVLNMKEDSASDSAFILISNDEGPGTWQKSVLEANVLDFGGSSVISVEMLI